MTSTRRVCYFDVMPELQLLRADHASALFIFERQNRSYFAASIPDRGDAYFSKFMERHRELVAWQADGTNFPHVLVEVDGTIVGRFNLIEVDGGSAELGYRMAERVTGRGLATATVLQVCSLAVVEYGLRVLHAKTTIDNVRSRSVLNRTGFVPTGELTLNGRPGISYERELNSLIQMDDDSRREP